MTFIPRPVGAPLAAPAFPRPRPRFPRPRPRFPRPVGTIINLPRRILLRGCYHHKLKIELSLRYKLMKVDIQLHFVVVYCDNNG